MKISTFIVIDDKLKSKRSEWDDDYTHTLSGEWYFPLETPLPIIQKGVGCVGIGMVTSIKITKSATTIVFVSSNVSTSSAEAYYGLYRNQISTSDSSDVYEQEDVVIPGMMNSVKMNGSKTPEKPRYRGRTSSLDAYMDDDY